jgi:hypothetical protein
VGFCGGCRRPIALAWPAGLPRHRLNCPVPLSSYALAGRVGTNGGADGLAGTCNSGPAGSDKPSVEVAAQSADLRSRVTRGCVADTNE